MNEVSKLKDPGKAEFENNGQGTCVPLLQEAPHHVDLKRACALSFVQQSKVNGSSELRSLYPRLFPLVSLGQKVGGTGPILDTIVVKRKILVVMQGNELLLVLCMLISSTVCDVKIASEV